MNSELNINSLFGTIRYGKPIKSLHIQFCVNIKGYIFFANFFNENEGSNIKDLLDFRNL